MTGWGQDGPLAQRRRPRHQLHRARRRAATRSAARASRRCRRSTWSATSAAAACCSPSACSARCSRRARSGQRPGGRRRDGRRRGRAAWRCSTACARVGMWRDDARHQPARHRRALLRGLRDRATASTWRSARSSRSSTPSCCERSGLDERDAAAADGPRALARAEGALRRGVHARGRATSGARCSRAATPASRRCSASTRRPQHPHNAARGTFVEVGGVCSPRPRRASAARSPTRRVRPPTPGGRHRRRAARVRAIGRAHRAVARCGRDWLRAVPCPDQRSARVSDQVVPRARSQGRALRPARGPLYDRRFMLVDEAGKFLTPARGAAAWR